MNYPKIQIRFNQPRYGYWDGGKKDGGIFKVESINDMLALYPNHPGTGGSVRWGCWGLNFWFVAGSGRSWKEAVAIAVKKLKRICLIPRVEIEAIYD